MSYDEKQIIEAIHTLRREIEDLDAHHQRVLDRVTKVMRAVEESFVFRSMEQSVPPEPPHQVYAGTHAKPRSMGQPSSPEPPQRVSAFVPERIDRTSLLAGGADRKKAASSRGKGSVRIEPAGADGGGFVSFGVKRFSPPTVMGGMGKGSNIIKSSSASEKLAALIRDYNEMANIGGGAALAAAYGAYIKKYDVVGLVCQNKKKRLERPHLKPLFGAAGASGRGEFWAVPISSGLYAAVPGLPMNYDETLHVAGGMKEMFDSNFDGGTYARAKVAIPSILVDIGGWVINKRGRIVLSA